MKSPEEQQTLTELEAAFGKSYRIDPLPEELDGFYECLSVLSCKRGRRVCLLQKRETGEKRIYKESSDPEGRRSLETEYCFLLVLGESTDTTAYRRNEETGLEYLLRPYYEGVTLQQYVESAREQNTASEKEGLSTEEAIALMRSVCREVAKLHRQDPPLVHRDLKPSNILRCPDGSCRIIDFESLREFKEGEEHDTVYMGTRETAAPEQFGYRQTTVQTDIYTLGVLFLYLLTGGYSVNTPGWNGLPREVRHCINKCLSFDPEGRYGSVAELDRDLACIGRLGLRFRTILFRAAAGILGVLALFLGTLGILKAAGILGNKPVRFANAQIEEAVRKANPEFSGRDIYPEDLSRVTVVVLCGDRTFASWEQHKEFHDDNWAFCDQELAPMESADLSDLAMFPNLNTLVLCNQGLETLPDLSVYPKLKQVNFFHNSLTDLSGFTGTEHLDIVDLTKNQVSDLMPLQGNLRLRCLRLRGNNVPDMSPLAELNLQILDLLDNPVEDLSFLDNMPNLTTLRLSGVSSEDVGRIAALKKLDELEIFNYRMENLEPLSELREMNWLSITQSPGLTSLEGIQKMRHLEGLDIQNTGITDISLLRNCTHLTYLSICLDRIEDYSVLKELPKLRKLSVDFLQEPEIRSLGLENVELEYH